MCGTFDSIGYSKRMLMWFAFGSFDSFYTNIISQIRYRLTGKKIGTNGTVFLISQPCFLHFYPGILVFVLSLTCLILQRASTRNVPSLYKPKWFCVPVLKLGVNAVALVAWLSVWISTVIIRRSIVSVLFPTFMILTLSCLFATQVGSVQKGLRGSGPVFFSWLFLIIVGFPEFVIISHAWWNNQVLTTHHADAVYLVHYCCGALELCLQGFADRPSRSFQDAAKPCPIDWVSFPNRVTFWWYTGFGYRAWRNTITLDDLWSLREEQSSDLNTKKWDRFWHAALTKWKTVKRKSSRPSVVSKSITMEKILPPKRGPSQRYHKIPSLSLVLLQCVRGPLLQALIVDIIGSLLLFTYPLVVKWVIEYVEDTSQPMWLGLCYLSVLMSAVVITSVIIQWKEYLGNVCALQLRSILTHVIFTKALKLNNEARCSSTTGEIVNLMSTDVLKIEEFCLWLTNVITGPMSVIIAIPLIWRVLGPSTLAAFGVLIAMSPITMLVSHLFNKFLAKQMVVKDKRLNVITEILSGIKLLKFFAWEQPFEDRVGKLRKEELRLSFRSKLCGATFNILYLVTPFLASSAAFATYVLSDPSGHQLTPKVAFVALTLFNLVQFPINAFSIVLTFGLQARISLRRIANFLGNDELEPLPVQSPNHDVGLISARSACFTWQDSSYATLSDIDLHVTAGQLVMVVGHVGSGKSSLVQAMLGEMVKTAGEFSVVGSRAYVSQQAWIQNSTVRDNITFSKDYKARRFSQVMEACCLLPDVAQWPGGVLTEIGERGVNLSGGQKQRISLARAVYQDCDLYFLDDPLSAVDAHVGKKLFDDVIGNDGILCDKTRILVTNAIQYTRFADLVVMMKHGRIAQMGKYVDLADADGPFRDFLLNADVQNTIAEDSTQSSAMQDRGKSKSHGAIDSLSASLLDCTPKSHLSMIHLTVDQTLRPGDIFAEQVRHRSSSDSEKGLLRLASRQDRPMETVRITDDEEEYVGSISSATILSFLKALGWLPVVFALAMHCGNGLFVGWTNVWLAQWSNAYDRATNGTNETVMYLAVYCALGVGSSICGGIASTLTAFALITASARLHKQLLDGVLKAPMHFFDRTPLGRVTNRFSKDITVLDDRTQDPIDLFFNTLMLILSTIVIIMMTTAYSIVPILPLVVVYVLLQRFYTTNSRQIMRIESTSRSPVYSFFQESLRGAPTIRAYGHQRRFIARSQNLVDGNVRAGYALACAEAWLANRLETISALVIFVAALSCIAGREALSPGYAGLTMAVSMTMMFYTGFSVKMACTFETNLVAVERIADYAAIEQEADWYTPDDPPLSWPSKGRVVFHKYETRYRPDLEPVLHNIDFEISPGEKVGIVGRTGAGKSSLTLALFRILEASSGSIEIDGYTIAKVGLQTLRSRLTIIPQDPLLFAGTIRSNLDPTDAYSDAVIWRALHACHLDSLIASLDNGLGSDVHEGGENLSVGQRQLLCLARAVLRQTRILVLDEATASIDLECDQLIQGTIRNEFPSTTVITIAHRVNTILDYDRVLVLDKGEVVEFDTPSFLLRNPESMFRKLADDAGIAP